MRYYKVMCLIIAADIALFGIISMFYRPVAGTTTFVVMKNLFFIPLIMVSALQLIGLVMNVACGHVNTIGVTRFVVYRFATSPLLFIFGVAWELVLWIFPMYAITGFLAESSN